MKFELGEIVNYQSRDKPGMNWLFIIVGILTNHGVGGHYYKTFCFKAPENHISSRDLHQTIQMSEAALSKCTLK